MEEGLLEVTSKDLAALQKQYESELPHPSGETTFNYAWGLIRSSRQRDIDSGIALLQGLLKTAPAMRREAYYSLGLGHFKLGQYSQAKEHAQLLLRLEPENPQGLSLMDAINKQVQKDGLIGMALVGGAVAAAGLVIGLLTRK